MAIKIISHSNAIAIKQHNQQLEKELLLTPLPTITNDIIRTKVFNNPTLKLTNWSHEIALKRKQQAITKKAYSYSYQDLSTKHYDGPSL